VIGVIFARQSICAVNRCNLACTYCWYETGAAGYPNSTVPTAVLARWFDRCRAAGPLSVAYLTGGEPLLRTDFDELLLTAHDYFTQVVVLSNATTVTEETARRFAALGTRLHVSLDRVSPDLGDRVRGGTAATLRGLHHLAAAGVPTRVTMIVTTRNHTDLPVVVELCRRLRLGLEVNPVAVPEVHPLSLRTLAAGDRQALIDGLAEARDLLGRPSYYARVARYLRDGRLAPLGGCQAVATGVFIEADGAISLCGQRRHGLDNLGDVRSASLDDVLAAHRRAGAARVPGSCVSLDCLTVA